MARVSYTVYKNAPLATAISFLSSMFAMGGIAAVALGVMDGDFVMIGFGVVLAAACGFGGSALAETINTHQSNAKWWKNVIRKQGLEARIPNSVDVCFQVYNANPSEWTLSKIQALNPSGAAQIRQTLAAKK